MTLLFITRKIDRADTRTGFVFDWVGALSSRLDTLYIICQEKGELGKLPDNVEVYSLGKESGAGKLSQGYKLIVNCYKFAKNADGIFAHMMPIYAILAWFPARLRGKKLVLWYTHKSVDTKLKIAATLADTVLTASKESFRFKTPKVKAVGHGIPINKFNAKNTKKDAKNAKGGKDVSRFSHRFRGFRIISIGRISRVKDYETLIKAIEILVNDRGIKDIQCEIYGEPALPADKSYLASLETFIRAARLQDYVKFQGGTAYERVPKLYQQANLFVNLSATGSLDKTVLEAAASKTLAMSSNEAFEKNLKEIDSQLFFERNNPQDLAEKIQELKNLPEEERAGLQQKLFDWVSREHNLDTLARRVLAEFSKSPQSLRPLIIL